MGTHSLVAACGGDTIKLFDVAVETGDPCTFQFTPSLAAHVNCVKWNHTNLVVASAGDDRKISLWMKNGQIVGVLPQPGNDIGESIDESIVALSFSNKGSRYLCSGGTGKVIRVWDLQRKRCIKWLKGHTDTVTGVMYNNKDEHLASISMKGDLILHNLASGTRAAELKDPHEQVLRVLDYSRLSRHILTTAGDDGSVHLWDTTGRNPKVSWFKQHSAPTTGVVFSPSNDKVIMSVGLDKKLYTFDSGMKKFVQCIPCEAPFSSLAIKDDGLILAAGTNSGRVVFYDVRGKPQPFTILRAYGTSEAVTSLCWQRSNPIFVNEATCSMEAALIGVIGDESVLMPDPLPASIGNTHGRSALGSMPAKTSTRSQSGSSDGASLSMENSSIGASLSGLSEDDTFGTGARFWTRSSVSRLQTPHTSYNVKDDMEVFSPLVDVQPITPSIPSFWDMNDDIGKEFGLSREPSLSDLRKFPLGDEMRDDSFLSADRRSSSLQDDLKVMSGPSSPVATTPPPGISPRGDRSPSVTPPEAWGGDVLSDKVTLRQKSTHPMSRFASLPTIASGPSNATSKAGTLNADLSPLASSDGLGIEGLRASQQSQRASLDFSVSRQSDTASILNRSNSPGSSIMMQPNASAGPDASSELTSMLLSKKYAPYTERIGQSSLSRSTGSSAPEGSLSSRGSPGKKKLPLERSDDRNGLEGTVEGRKETDVGHLMRPEVTAATSPALTASNGYPLRSSPVHEQGSHGPPSFALQLVQRTLEESLGAVQKAIHEDVQNLHLELLRQFHIQQTEMEVVMETVITKQNELMAEIQHLRRENQQLRQLL